MIKTYILIDTQYYTFILVFNFIVSDIIYKKIEMK